MPKIVNFDGRQIIEPGVYSTIKGGSPVPPVQGTYGNVFIIDTGIGKTYGHGSGISGELSEGTDAVYEFTSSLDCKKAFGGGVLWDLMDYLWNPSNNGRGINRLFYARAATTVAAFKTITFSSGVITVKARNEGIRGNGETNVTTGKLVKGYSMKLIAGIVDPNKFILQFFEGQYRGKDSSGFEYETDELLLNDHLMFQSDEILNVNEIKAWMERSIGFRQYFVLSSYTASAVSLVTADVTNFSTHQKFAGGTETYSTTDLDIVLESIPDVDNSMFLLTDYGYVATPPNAGAIQAGANKGAMSSWNDKILEHINNGAVYKDKIAWVGGGQDAAEWSNTLDISDYYKNTDHVVNVHSAAKVVSSNNTVLPYKFVDTLYHAAMWCGRVAGLEPQVSATYKDIRIIGLKHELNKSQRELGLLSGVFHARYVTGLGYVCNQAVTTLSPNSALMYPNGVSPEIQIVRIKHQLNKELMINGTKLFIGSNINTSNPEDIKTFTEGYLQSKTATKLNDNLIIRFESVKVTFSGNDYNVTYCFVPNAAINRMFFTGYAIDPNLSI